VYVDAKSALVANTTLNEYYLSSWVDAGPIARWSWVSELLRGIGGGWVDLRELKPAFVTSVTCL
jgi:hypothetical protein